MPGWVSWVGEDAAWGSECSPLGDDLFGGKVSVLGEGQTGQWPSFRAAVTQGCGTAAVGGGRCLREGACQGSATSCLFCPHKWAAVL